MHASARLFVFVLVEVLATTQIVLAQSNAETASSWGLIGSWRVDCRQPPSRTNDQQTFVVRARKLFLDRKFGDRRDSNAVVLATIASDGGIVLTLKFDCCSETHQWEYIKGGDGRMRAIFNKNLDNGEYSIRDSKYTANGKDTFWYARCR
jgi:hypothetical protein